MFKRATGFEYKEVKSVPDGTGKDKKMVVKEVVLKYIPPDPTSMFYWLKNRRPKEWRDKREIEHGGSLSVMPPLSTLFDDD